MHIVFSGGTLWGCSPLGPFQNSSRQLSPQAWLLNLHLSGSQGLSACPVLLSRAPPSPENGSLALRFIPLKRGNSISFSRHTCQHLIVPGSQGILICIAMKFQLFA